MLLTFSPKKKENHERANFAVLRANIANGTVFNLTVEPL